jgi:hypothetical protein
MKMHVETVIFYKKCDHLPEKATNASIVVECRLQTFREARMTCRTLRVIEPCHFPNILHDSFLIITRGIVLSSRLAVQSSRSLKTSRRKVASDEASRVKGCASTKFYIAYVQRALLFHHLPPASSALDDCFAPSCGTLHDPLRVRDILPPIVAPGQAKLLCIRLL